MAGVSLFDYQKDAVERMHNGCILCGGVGSGKSRTALAYYYIQNGGQVDTKDYVRMHDPPDLYIITTARKRDDLEWEQELVPFLMSTDYKTNLYSNRIFIDSWNNIKKYADVSSAFFIFDEQRVVGSGAWVKSFLKIAKRNSWILLSATPGDTWMDYIPVFVANGFFRNRTEFIREHVVYSRHTTFPKVDRYLNEGRLIRLRRRILVDMDFNRETVSHHIDIFTDYDSVMFKTMMKQRWDIWKGEPFQNAGELCYALRKLVNSDPSRVEEVLNIFRSHPKIIVFYNFDYELDILKRIQWPSGVEVAEWNGHKHQPIPESKSWVYLVQYTAGAEGWNCIKTDTIIFFSQNYSYKVLVQASGRIDRLNTPFRDLYYYHLKSHASIDLAIARAIREKRNFNETRFVNNG